MISALKTVFPVAVVLLAACQPAPPKTADPARAAVAAARTALLARHDSAMAQTNELRDLKEQIGQRADGIRYARSLDGADAAMLRWMNAYAPDTAKPAAAQLVYFQEQQAKLAAVEARLQSALDSGRALVGRR